jgi:1-acyl-sn-glycerol-3-phosphate acyltransferase
MYFFAKSFSYCFLKALEILCGINYTLEQQISLPQEPSIVLSNHQSFWENILMIQIFPMQSWVIKQELCNIPIFGWGLKFVGPVPIDRGHNMSVRQILVDGAQKIKRGLWMIIFPEGTRVDVTRRVSLKPSGIKLAQETGAPIVLMVHNAGLFWPKGLWMTKPGVIAVKIAKILYVKPEDDVKTVTLDIENWMVKEKDLLSGIKSV